MLSDTSKVGDSRKPTDPPAFQFNWIFIDDVAPHGIVNFVGLTRSNDISLMKYQQLKRFVLAQSDNRIMYFVDFFFLPFFFIFLFFFP